MEQANTDDHLKQVQCQLAHVAITVYRSVRRISCLTVVCMRPVQEKCACACCAKECAWEDVRVGETPLISTEKSISTGKKRFFRRDQWETLVTVRCGV